MVSILSEQIFNRFQYDTGLKITDKLKYVPEKKAYSGIRDYLSKRKRKKGLFTEAISGYVYGTDLEINLYNYKDNNLKTSLNFSFLSRGTNTNYDNVQPFLMKRCDHDTRFHRCIIPKIIITEAIFSLSCEHLAAIFAFYLDHMAIPFEIDIMGEKIKVRERRNIQRLRNKYKKMNYTQYRYIKKKAIEALIIRIIQIQSEM